ncbi:hypothetical protein H2200_008806 [Cladophialophora chaetospira]|uniref:RmlC-like cupin domain-containing protein n=1 Tax=Cladophialophora chaetospira TaxID=386627 RepID=A0AA38X4W3_9EURO|nr:hypothetical protein H2200_008806 [Cladophialophora chaetospira]
MFSSLCLLFLAFTAACAETLSPSKSSLLDSGQHALNQSNPTASPTLNKSNETFYITAVTNHPDPPYLARLQCWSLTSSFTVYPTVGKSLPLGDVDNVTYVVLPRRSGEGWHRAPHAMYFVLLSGLAQVYVPKHEKVEAGDSQERLAPTGGGWRSAGSVQGGPDQPRPDDENWDFITIMASSPQQVLIAVDTDLRARGHLTFYPGDGETVALQIPFREGVVPEHRVVHEGGCTDDE